MEKGGEQMSRKGKNSDVSFLGRVLIFFRPLWTKIKEKRIFRTAIEKQKTLALYTGTDSVEESKLSYCFGVARIICIILLVLLLLITVLFGGSRISYEKMYYMFKDISYIKSFGESTPSSLSYAGPIQNQVFSSFKGGLAVASDSEIKTFTSTGRVTMSIGSEFTNPKLSSSNGYLLVYDQGSNSYAIYNSFICVHSEKLEFPISFACMAENGSFLVVTGAQRYDSMVKVYNSDFELVSEYSKNDRVISASLSSDGRYAAVLSIAVQQGESVVSLNVIDCKKNEVVSKTVWGASMPYRCDFLTDDRIAVILDDRVSVIDRDGRTKGDYIFPSSLERIDVSNEKFALLFAESDLLNKKTVSVFDKEGRLTFSDTTHGNVRDMKLGEDSVYLLQSGRVTRISTLTGSESSCSVESDARALVVFFGEAVVVCTQSAARYISFD